MSRVLRSATKTFARTPSHVSSWTRTFSSDSVGMPNSCAGPASPTASVNVPMDVGNSHDSLGSSSHVWLVEAPWKDQSLDYMAACENVMASTSSDLWQQHLIWNLNGNELASYAASIARVGASDPFYWHAIRLRARMIYATLKVQHLAVLLGCCLKVGLVDVLFLTMACRRLDTILRWEAPKAKPLILCCSALLRLGLDPRNYLFVDLMRCIAQRFSKPSAFEGSLLATCLSRLKWRDSVLLHRAMESIGATASAKECTMVFQAFAQLRLHRPADIASRLHTLLEDSRFMHKLGSGITKDNAVKEVRSILIGVITAELLFSRTTDLLQLAELAGKHLAGLKRLAAKPNDLHVIVETCRRWSISSAVFLKFAPRALHELSAWSEEKRPSWRPLHTKFLLQYLGVLVPCCCEHGKLPDAMQALLSKLCSATVDLSIVQLIETAEMCAQLVGHDASTNTDSHNQWSMALRSELYVRAKQIPLPMIPRAFAAMHQLLSLEDLTPLLRRCAGRLINDLRAALEDGTCDRARVLDADALGELLYVYAACNYNDETFLGICRAWILAENAALLGNVKRNVSFVHLLHSLALLEVATGELLLALVSAASPRLSEFNSFELLGFLDAASNLQMQAIRSAGMDAEAPPPSGVGETALQIACSSFEALLPQVEDDELCACARLLEAMRLPEGSGNAVFNEVSVRKLDLHNT